MKLKAIFYLFLFFTDPEDGGGRARGYRNGSDIYFSSKCLLKPENQRYLVAISKSNCWF